MKKTPNFQYSTMSKFHSPWFSCIFFLLCTTFSGKTNAAHEERKVYIVYMGANIPKIEKYSLSAYHSTILQQVVDASFPEQYLVRSFTKSFNAFAANLTKQEYENLAAHEEVVSIFPSRTLQLLTTESWDFTGVPLNVNRNLTMESDVIIGVLDTGIWPESESFSGEGLGPVPEKWKGTCEGGKNFTCNRKIIGARHYDIDNSARDYVGHGSHTASTAAGNIVPNASFYGVAKGTARGGVPSARIAIYKVCDSGGCQDQEILAAFDDAIADGVDILSVSLGANYPIPFQYDAIAIGSFHAALKGILTVHAAGNNGFNSGQIDSVVPWLFSVAASTTKRQFISKVSLKNGKILAGRAVNSFNLNGTNFPLIYGSDAAKECSRTEAKLCSFYCLDKKKVKGKIIICSQYTDNFLGASMAGALGAIAIADTLPDVADVVPLPASVINNEQSKELESYYYSIKNPQASISYSEAIDNKTAPVVPAFSSRGPNRIFADILKPDIIAPGVDILASYSPDASPSSSITDERSVKYNILSGTSMSCPHVAGAAGYVKSWHPDWSPSAIKSALMTTAWRMEASHAVHGDAEFSYGAGHFDPLKALNPGLVYETLKEDYVEMICNMDFDNSTLKKIFGDKTTCPEEHNPPTPKDLNYPSMCAHVGRMAKFSVTFRRTVTNVGIANSTYKAIISRTPEYNITVNPSVLSFQAMKERKSFNLTISGNRGFINMISASLEWSDGIHSVRSPIVIYRRRDIDRNA